ncbi:MAG: TIGR03960 family B12-binding radical SAM protein [bacterium]|nr:TIGR03960 family B12-binding radical SAM protein [bacterium]
MTRAAFTPTKLRSLLEDEILPAVNRPGRYIGSELNIIRKEHSGVDVTVALAFPDLYEIGMSHLGIQILYDIINKIEWAAAERVFAPWVDMEQKLREKGVPLYSLETFTPMRDFDLVGFSLSYELCYTNVLNMLDLGGIPLRFSDRCREGGPLVIAGGLGSFVPEPMWEFIDLFVVGDGEEVIVELLEEFRRHATAKGRSKKRLPFDSSARMEFLRAAAKKLKGIYVPHLYRTEYGADGLLLRTEPVEEGIPETVQKRVVDLASSPYPEKPIVPLVEVVHNRAVVEIARGCRRACRFCQARSLYRPVRELPASEIVRRAVGIIQSTGFEQISLSSLSTADHTEIEDILSLLSGFSKESHTAISLPSLRPDSFSVELLERIGSSKKSGITLAVEAATSRLRAVINKRIEDEDVLSAAEAAYRHGWNLVKLYFMIGLPTETDEDVAALARLVQNIADVRKRVDGRRGNVNVSIACFVPKAHTPFQWEKFHNVLELKRKISYIKRLIRGRNIKLKFHDPEKSYLEAVFSRGDRRLSAVIHRAWLKGCRLDDWSEHFCLSRWVEAFRESNVDPDFYASRERRPDEVFPWDHISCGLSNRFLSNERERAMASSRNEAESRNAAPE